MLYTRSRVSQIYPMNIITLRMIEGQLWQTTVATELQIFVWRLRYGFNQRYFSSSTTYFCDSFQL